MLSGKYELLIIPDVSFKQTDVVEKSATGFSLIIIGLIAVSLHVPFEVINETEKVSARSQYKSCGPTLFELEIDPFTNDQLYFVLSSAVPVKLNST